MLNHIFFYFFFIFGAFSAEELKQNLGSKIPVALEKEASNLYAQPVYSEGDYDVSDEYSEDFFGTLDEGLLRVESCDTQELPICKADIDRFNMTELVRDGDCPSAAGSNSPLHLGIGNYLNETAHWIQIRVCYNLQRREAFWSFYHLFPQRTDCCPATSSQGTFLSKFVDFLPPMDTLYAGSRWDKGHLTPVRDFYTETEKAMTYYYVNVAPQHPSLNSGWSQIEDRIGSFLASQEGRQRFVWGLLITTGTLTHPDLPTPGEIRVPHYFWKIVVDGSDLRSGVAFIGINDIQQVCSSTNIVEKNITAICKRNRCRDIGLFETYGGDSLDLIYCCTVPELAAALTNYNYGQIDDAKVRPPYTNGVTNLLIFSDTINTPAPNMTDRGCPRPVEP